MGTLLLNYYHQSLAADRSLGSTCPGLAETNSSLAQVSASHCLIFCDDKLTSSVASPHTE